MNDIPRVRNRLAHDFHDVMTDIDALMAATANQAEGQAGELRARILERLAPLKHRVRDMQHETVERARHAADATDTYVHQHPWQVIGLAAAVGVAVGALIARR